MLDCMINTTHLKHSLLGAFGALAITTVMALPAHAATEKIVFNNDFGQVVAINPDGSGRQVLATGALPKIAPGGQTVAYSRCFNLGIQSACDLFTVGIDGTGNTMITGNSLAGSQILNQLNIDSHPEWSPDGTKLAAIGNHNNVPGIYVYNLDGSNRQLIYPFVGNGGGQFLSWSRVRNQLAFEDDGQIAIINADGTGYHRITTSVNLSHYEEPQWSPDGTRLSATYNCNCDVGLGFHTSGNVIVTMKSDGTGVQTIVPAAFDGDVNAATWSPDGSQIAYARYEPAIAGRYRLYQVPATGGSSTFLYEEIVSLNYPNWGGSQSTPTVTSPVNLHASTPTKQPALTWDLAPAALQYRIYRNGIAVDTVDTNAYLDPATLADGAYTYTVSAIDLLGTESPQSDPIAVVVDNTAPTLSSLSWNNTNPLQQGQTATLAVAATDAPAGMQSVEYRLENGAWSPMTYDAATQTWRTSFGDTLAVNTYNVDIQATDEAGNVASLSDILAVYNAANGYVIGRDWAVPTTETLPIPLEVRTNFNKPAANIVYGFTNVKAATVTSVASGSFNVNYTIDQNKNEFSLSSTKIDWLVIPDATHASVQGKADLVTYINGTKTTLTGVTVRFDIALNAAGAADSVMMKIYEPGITPGTTNYKWSAGDNTDPRQSLIQIKP